MIKIGNKCNGDTGEYCGRGSPLGNPFPITPFATRDDVCDLYEAWIQKEIKRENKKVCDELNRLFDLSLKKDLTLICYCAPRRCHCETIKKLLEEVSPKWKILSNKPVTGQII